MIKKNNSLPLGVTCEVKEGGMNNKSSRLAKLEFLQNEWQTVAILNKKDEYEIVSSKYCKRGDIVWVLERNNTFTKTKIF